MPKENAVKLEPVDEVPVAKVIATGISLVVGLADDRQMTFQSGFEGDETDEAVNGRLDRLMRFADRQKARYEIKGLVKRLAQHRQTMAQHDIDRVEIEINLRQVIAQREVELEERIRRRPEERLKAQEDIDTAILQMQEVRKIEFDSGLEEHSRSGRGGSYVPKGARKVNIDRIDKQIETAKKSRELALEDFDSSYDAHLATAESEIEKARAELAENIKLADHRRDKWIEMEGEMLAEIDACQAMIDGS